MKTSLLYSSFFCLLMVISTAAKANSPPSVLADTITIQFHTGYGMDCNGSGRQCLAAQPMTNGEIPALTSHGVAKAWFDAEGHFVMEVRQVFSTSLYYELEGGTFYLEVNVPLTGGVMAALGRSGQLYSLPAGVHSAKKQLDNSYRIVF